LLLGLFLASCSKAALASPIFLQPALRRWQLGRQFVAVPILAVLAHPFGIAFSAAASRASISCFRRASVLVHVLVAHRLVLAGVGLDLGSIDGHMAQLHQSSLGTQQQSLA